jgi:chorismate mutase/GNAT superfamily N-acetyltransferase
MPTEHSPEPLSRPAAQTSAEVSHEEFELRPGFREDLPDLQEVFEAASTGPGLPPATRTPDEIRAWCRSLLDQPGRELWVATRDGVLLGFVVVEGEWVNLLFVHPDRPARGVGAALLDLVKSLRPHGFGLRVYQINERALAFYARHGLIELERTDGSGYLDAEPDVQMAWLGADPLAYLRRRIDAVDDELAVLLARRTALTGAVQDHKATTGEYAGQRGRDAEREAEIVARMAQRVPELGPERIARVMHSVIEESIAAWESGGGSPPS